MIDRILVWTVLILSLVLFCIIARSLYVTVALRSKNVAVSNPIRSKSGLLSDKCPKKGGTYES